MSAVALAASLWDANEHSEAFSRNYDDTWAVKLFNGFRRHISLPHRCVLYTDRPRKVPHFVQQVIQPDLGSNGYGDVLRPFEMNEPMILVGLDTLIVGPIDKYAQWCLDNPGKLALPKHPYNDLSINGVQFWGGHDPSVFANWKGENDMAYMRTVPHERIDELWPGRVVSLKAHVIPNGPGSAHLVYMHGKQKADRLAENSAWVRYHWNGA